MLTVEEATGQAYATANLMSVECTLDGSPEASAAVLAVIDRCRRSGAELRLVAVLSTRTADRDEHVQLVRGSQDGLIDAIRAARAAGISFTATSRCC
jgi:hypothetical protein